LTFLKRFGFDIIRTGRAGDGTIFFLPRHRSSSYSKDFKRWHRFQWILESARQESPNSRAVQKPLDDNEEDWVQVHT